MHGMVRRGAILLGALGIVAFFAMHSHVWISRQLARHTPTLTVNAPDGMGALPIHQYVPTHRWLLWVPGVDLYVAHRMKRHFPSVKEAKVIGDFQGNRVVVHLDARQPLVLWNGFGIDAEGVVFPLLTEAPMTLPQLHPAHQPPAKRLGPWLAALAKLPWLWPSVTDLTENDQGHWALTSAHGPVLLWGSSDEPVAPRAVALQKILADAQAEHGGALRADLRFFDEGRIIVGVRRSPH